MKKTILSIAVALFAIIGFTACTNDDDDVKVPETKDLVGEWITSFTNKYVQADDSEIYKFNADGTCTINIYSYLANPDEQEQEKSGCWSLEKKDGKSILTVTYTEGSENGGERSQTIRYTITKFSADKFNALAENSTQEKYFRIFYSKEKR